MLLVDLMICEDSNSTKIGQSLLHWGCEIVLVYFFVHIKMSHYLFNRQEILRKAKDRYHNCGGKEEAAKYYLKGRK